MSCARYIFVNAKLGKWLKVANVAFRPISYSVVPDINLSKYCKFENEPVLSYKPCSPELEELTKKLKEMACKVEAVPILIDGKEHTSGVCRSQKMPHKHSHELAKFYYADDALINKAIDVAVCGQAKWDRTSVEERAMIWERAADLMATTYRQDLNAATMLGQGKTIIQAEIDAAAELVDFMRLNTFYYKELCQYSPISKDEIISKNSFRNRGLGGFVAAITPFNFTAICGNLAYTPALMGNTVVWKPNDTAVLSNWIIYKVMLEAGLPPGIVSFVPADGPQFGNVVTNSISLSGINFTGSAATFKHLWGLVGKNINSYKYFPRLIGECGGKNFHFVHPSADIETVVNGTIRSAYEYSGQKCSACSRMYVPESLWQHIRPSLQRKRCTLKVGDVTNVTTFMSAVIDDKAFKRITSYIDYAKGDRNKFKILGGGGYSCDVGYFIEPTLIQTMDPCDKLMTEEIFGPVLTIYVYKDCDLDDAMRLVTQSTKYGLTGAVFAQDEDFLRYALEEFKMVTGNFYINDKSTGSVVGQQPFGGSLMSGTNDKAGGPHYILRWTSPQSIKETFVPLCEVDYPYMRTYDD